MLVFALMLIAGGLAVAVALVAFLSENLLAGLAAILAGQAALATGGGWPGAVVAAALTFAAVSAGLRLAILCTRSLGVRCVLASLIVAPAAVVSFVVTDALLWSVVPAPVWRTCLAVIAALVSAAGACRRLWTLSAAA